jgi:hypothetical protein
MEIVKRSDDMKGFVVLPRRWWSSAPCPGSSETGVSPRISKNLVETLGIFRYARFHPALPSGGLPGRSS